MSVWQTVIVIRSHINKHTFDFEYRLPYILDTNRKLNTTEKMFFFKCHNRIRNKKWETKKKCKKKKKFQWQFLILCLWWFSLFLVTMRWYRRPILLKSVKGSHLRACIKKTTWNVTATNQFLTNGKLKPTRLYCNTYYVIIKFSSVQNWW